MTIKFYDYQFSSESLANTLASKLTLGEKEDNCGWTYVATKVPGRNAWTVDVYDEDGERLGAL
jgi:hypothetical protein